MGPGETNEQLGKGEGAAQKVETHPTITIASADESTMNVSGEADFLEDPLHAANFGELLFHALG